jgi:Xaa-Pro aminopeptidase
MFIGLYRQETTVECEEELHAWSDSSSHRVSCPPLGTGHGVGAALNVHEGPQSISPHLMGRSISHPLCEGMIVSIEPGYYETGAFGIRLENLYLIKRSTPASDLSENYYQFEPLTYVPFQRNLIERSLLSFQQIEWINCYHQQVYERINGLMMMAITDDQQSQERTAIREWLDECCQPI